MNGDTLPREIWLAVLQNLSYIDLKNCFRVCTTFKHLLDSPIFSVKLFKGSVLERLQESDMATLQLHPALDIFHTECATDIREVQFYGSSNKEYDPQNYKVCDELASNPGVTIIRMQVHRFPVFVARNKHGVTVLDDFHALCDFIGTSPHGKMERISSQGKSEGSLPSGTSFDSEEEYEDGGRTEIYRDFLGDHTGFNGWDEKLLDSEGRLVLRALWFDS